jgi:predicted transcriptional regulator
MEITEKQRAIDALRALPDQATIADAIERLCFIAKIEEGLRQSNERRLATHDEIKRQFLSRERFCGPSKLAPTWPPSLPSSAKIRLTTRRSSLLASSPRPTA